MTSSRMLLPFTVATLLAGCSMTSLPEESQEAFLRDQRDSSTISSFVDAEVRAAMREYDVPGMAVAVTIGGQPYFFNYGVASRESGAPVSEQTLFELGSVSKIFTATLATYAHGLGKLSLDENPSRFLPQLKGSAIDRVSLVHLGTYTAGGLPLQFPVEVSDDSQMIRYFQQWEPETPPGLERRYSNPSIGLLGRIAGVALGSDFTDAVEARLLPGLGLTTTHINVPQHAIANYAWGHNAANEQVRVQPGMFDAEAYGIKSTTADMIRLVQLNIDASEIERPMRLAIEGTHVGHFRVGEMVQGLGWERYRYPASVDQLLEGNSRAMIMESNPVAGSMPSNPPSASFLLNKTGSTGGFGAYAAFVPERKIGVVLLANRNFPIPVRIRIAHAILGQLEAVR